MSFVFISSFMSVQVEDITKVFLFFFLAIGHIRIIATRYRLEGSGIESRGVSEIFRVHPDCPRGPPGLLYNAYGVCPGIKAAGSW